MRQIIAAIVLSVLPLGNCIRADAEDGAPEHEYPSLIHQATSFMLKGLGPTDGEKAAGETAMASLLRDKQQVAAYIIAQLKDYKIPYAGTRVTASNYGIVLRKFGPEYIRMLEPAVLQSKSEDAREAGAYILGRGNGAPSEARKIKVALLVNVLKRDRSPRVQAEAIHSLNNLRAVDQSEVISGYIASEHAIVRRAAVGFYWSYRIPHAFKILKDRLDVEKDPEVGFSLSRTLCKYPDFSASSLLKHDNPGIRCGALRYFSHPSATASREDYDAIVARLEDEKDLLCKYELASCLLRWRDARCLKLWIDLLGEKENPKRFQGGNNVKISAATALANLTDVRIRVTDEDRMRARNTGGSRYDRVIKEYDAWWTKNKNRLKWDGKRNTFVHLRKE